MSLEQVREDANKISCFLGLGGNEDLILKQLHEVRSKGPSFHKVLVNLIML